MRKYIFALIVIVMLPVVKDVYADTIESKFIPSDGYVPNAHTALAIAEAVWLPIYGERIYAKKPFRAELQGAHWKVTGTLSKGYIGGVPLVIINKKTGAIVRVSYGK